MHSDARRIFITRSGLRRFQDCLVRPFSGGDDRQVSVAIPEVGQGEVMARECGSVHIARFEDGQPVLTLIDRDGMLPTAGL